jgi:hypothetical protein
MSYNKKIRIDVQVDKQSIKTRTDRAGVVAKLTPGSALYQAQPTVQQAGVAVIAAGADLATADSAVKAAEGMLATARSAREAKVIDFDAAYDVYVANTEKHSVTAEDVQGVGLGVLQRGKYVLTQPAQVEARFDAVKSQIRLHVKQAPGMQACVVDVSPDPVGPATWTRLPGVGARQVLSGYAPGTYWVRAASVRASEQSEFTGPVSVIVK